MTVHARASHLNSEAVPPRLSDPLAGLKAIPQWVMWRLEQYDGEPKPRKVPYDPKTFQRADTTNPATWADFEYANNIVATVPEYKLGFVFTLNDPYIFVDLDSCRDPDTGTYNDEASHICTRLFPGVAAEVSQSGSGLHLIMRGDKTQFGNRRNKWGGRFEFYQHNRFIAIAGNEWIGNADLEQTASPQTFLPIREHDRDNQELETIRDQRWAGPEDDQELIARMIASDDKMSDDRLAELNDTIMRNPNDWLTKIEFEKLSKRVPFAALWNGDAKILRHHYPSPTGQLFDHSAADLALMNKLAFWSGKDHVRMIRLFSLSALGTRDKWLKRAYYRNRTASSSNAGCRDVYRGKRQEQRDKQRKENERIGEQIEFDTTSKLITLDEMLDSFYFVSGVGASGGVASAKTLNVLSVAVARNEYAPSKHSIEYTDKRTGETKTKVVPTFELWLPHEKRKRVDSVTWKPEGGAICDVPERVGLSGFNTWRGLIRPTWNDHFINDDQLRETWLTKWREHLAYLIPIESERDLFERWLAHILQHPGEKVETAWCFVANMTGIGRNWLGSVLSRVLRGYVLNNAILDVVLDGRFNGRMSRKLLMIVDEAKAGMRGPNTWALSEKLKTMVNPDFREINEKHGLEWVEHNAMRWLVFSNNWDALPIERDDRRWNIVENPTKPKSTAYYKEIYDLVRRDEFIAAVWAHLFTRSLDGFNVGDRSINNAARERMLSSVSTDLEQALKEFKDQCSIQVVDYITIENFLRQRAPGEQLNRTAIRRNLMKLDMIYLDKRIGTGNDKRRMVIVRDLKPADVYDNPARWLAVATHNTAAAFFNRPSE